MPHFGMQPYVYILASKHYGTLYVGVTGNLVQRISIHKGCDRRRLHQTLWRASARLLTSHTT